MQQLGPTPTATRLLDRRLIEPTTSASIGSNIQGPSLIRVPEWMPDALGRYYLYFADHKGAYIRMAYADDVTGPYTVHEPGTLQLAESGFPTTAPHASPEALAKITAAYEEALGPDPMPAGIELEVTAPHIASPDVHVDDDRRQIVMYFHGLEALASQKSRVAVSSDGLAFVAGDETLRHTYLRVFLHDGWHYGLAMPGHLYRSRDGWRDWEHGAHIFPSTMRHCALLIRDDRLLVFWTRVGDTPERIVMSEIDISGDWSTWTAGPGRDVLAPERPWEGADQPLVASRRGSLLGPANQLRDPAIFVDDDRTFLLYATAGESGIGIAELTF